MAMNNPKSISDADWRTRLSPEQYRVARQGGTERPFSGEHYQRTEQGDYHCICCGSLLFHADTKFDAGCGWPSFWAEAAGERIKRLRDTSHGMIRWKCAAPTVTPTCHVFRTGRNPPASATASTRYA
jgi:peptide-methionine (R)-S-oxide reductase